MAAAAQQQARGAELEPEATDAQRQQAPEGAELRSEAAASAGTEAVQQERPKKELRRYRQEQRRCSIGRRPMEELTWSKKLPKDPRGTGRKARMLERQRRARGIARPWVPKARIWANRLPMSKEVEAAQYPPSMFLDSLEESQARKKPDEFEIYDMDEEVPSPQEDMDEKCPPLKRVKLEQDREDEEEDVAEEERAQGASAQEEEEPEEAMAQEAAEQEDEEEDGAEGHESAAACSASWVAEANAPLSPAELRLAVAAEAEALARMGADACIPALPGKALVALADDNGSGDAALPVRPGAWSIPGGGTAAPP